MLMSLRYRVEKKLYLILHKHREVKRNLIFSIE